MPEINEKFEMEIKNDFLVKKCRLVDDAFKKLIERLEGSGQLASIEANALVRQFWDGFYWMFGACSQLDDLRKATQDSISTVKFNLNQKLVLEKVRDKILDYANDKKKKPSDRVYLLKLVYDNEDYQNYFCINVDAKDYWISAFKLDGNKKQDYSKVDKNIIYKLAEKKYFYRVYKYDEKGKKVSKGTGIKGDYEYKDYEIIDWTDFEPKELHRFNREV